MTSILHNILNNRFVQDVFAKIYMRLYSAYLDTNNLKLRQKYQIHPTVVWHPTTNLHGEGMIIIGKSTYIGANALIDSNPGGAKIEIGKFCAIAPNVHIRTIEYRTDIHFLNARFSTRKSSNIKIGNYVWIGTNVYICGGVEIGENSVVGANSVVTHDIPPHSICVGAPARVMRSKTAAAQEISDHLGNGNFDLVDL